ncbi:MAG: ATP-dependent Clp protease ATP-binding subunit [bacterium]
MPKDSFYRFTKISKQILLKSQDIAHNMHNNINSGHILLAIFEIKGNGDLKNILRSYGMTFDKIQIALNFSELTKTCIGSGITLEAKELIKSSMFSAKHLQSSRVLPEHLLITILEDKNFEGYKILEGLDVDIKSLLNKLQSRISGQTDYSDLKNFQDTATQDDLFSESRHTGGQFQSMPMGIQTIKAPVKSLKNYAVNLTEKAKKNELLPVVGRDIELRRVMRILARKTKNNPILVGESGVGKTAIVEGLANAISQEKIPGELQNKQIWALDLALLVAGTKYRGEFEDRVKLVLKEIQNNPNLILFIDEVHTIVGTGSAEGSMDAANILKPALARGEVKVIGATTYDDYRKYIEKDSALERRMQIVKVNEPTTAQTNKILQALKPNFEKHHNVRISLEAIRAATELSERYITDRFLPDKAIDVLDEACAEFSLEGSIFNNHSYEFEVDKIKDELIKNKKYNQAIKLKPKSKKDSKIKRPFVKNEDIAKVVSEWTSVPLSIILKDSKKRFADIEKKLQQKIIGQGEAINVLANTLRRSETGVSLEDRPFGSFIFLGPTGVGKTELAKVLAEEVFGNKDTLFKIDMSEFMEKHNVSRLVGAPPGYVGFDESGKLTEAIRQKPYSVVLFDEIEKAHPDVFNLLLQILEDGYLTDAKGRKVDFSKTIVIMTSNLGTKDISSGSEIGFFRNEGLDEREYYSKIQKKVYHELKDFFSPEFLNRVDRVLIFRPLTKSDLKKITKIQLNLLVKRLNKIGVKIKYDNKIIEYIVEKITDTENGARPIRRNISKLLEDPIAEILVNKKIKTNKNISIKIDNDKIIIK